MDSIAISPTIVSDLLCKKSLGRQLRWQQDARSSYLVHRKLNDDSAVAAPYAKTLGSAVREFYAETVVDKTPSHEVFVRTEEYDVPVE